MQTPYPGWTHDENISVRRRRRGPLDGREAAPSDHASRRSPLDGNGKVRLDEPLRHHAVEKRLVVLTITRPLIAHRPGVSAGQGGIPQTEDPVSDIVSEPVCRVGEAAQLLLDLDAGNGDIAAPKRARNSLARAKGHAEVQVRVLTVPEVVDEAWAPAAGGLGPLLSPELRNAAKVGLDGPGVAAPRVEEEPERLVVPDDLDGVLCRMVCEGRDVLVAGTGDLGARHAYGIRGGAAGDPPLEWLKGLVVGGGGICGRRPHGSGPLERDAFQGAGQVDGVGHVDIPRKGSIKPEACPQKGQNRGRQLHGEDTRERIGGQRDV